MLEFVYQRMERDPDFCAEIHRAINCCQDGNCTKTNPNNFNRAPVQVALDSFEVSHE